MRSWAKSAAEEFEFIASKSENYERISSDSFELAKNHLSAKACDLSIIQTPRAPFPSACPDKPTEYSVDEGWGHLADNSVAKIQRLIYNVICDLLSMDASTLSAWTEEW